MRYITDDIINKIKELHELGDYSGIAKLYATSKKNNNNITPSIIEEIKALHASGLSTRDIGRVLGISKTSVWGILKN